MTIAGTPKHLLGLCIFSELPNVFLVGVKVILE